jgi:hypothetical protein
MLLDLDRRTDAFEEECRRCPVIMLRPSRRLTSRQYSLPA